MDGRVAKTQFIFLLAIMAFPLTAGAADYYVNQATGNNANPGTLAAPWATISRCASGTPSLGPGDTCHVAPGTYNEVVSETTDGTSTSRIVYVATGSPKAKVRGFSISADYVTVEGFELTHTGMTGVGTNETAITISGANTGVLILNNDIHDIAFQCIRFGSSTFLTIRGNTISRCGTMQPADGHDLPGAGRYAAGIAASTSASTDVLIENNTISFVSDYVNSNGSKWVFRNSTIGPVDPLTGHHVDGVQNNALTNFFLMENIRSVSNASPDNHYMITSAAANNFIIRYGSTFLSKGGIARFGVSSADTGFAFYNNTFFDNNVYGNTQIQILIRSADVLARNNIWYRSVNQFGNATYFLDPGFPSAAVDKDYDLWFDQSDPIEANDVPNANPLFVDALNGNFILQATSPARNAGGPLTVVAAADTGTGTTLIVNKAYPFQDGWAGVDPDWIAIGSPTNFVQIARNSINYTTNTITLASSVTRNDGDPVWLFKKSDGAQVLFETAPDIGAFEFSVGADITAPAPGGSGAITTANIGSTGLTLNWTKATDAVTAQSALQYEVRQSSSNNISTLANAEANGTVIQAYTADIATLSVTGLAPSTQYFFNVIVRDAAGNKAVYTTKSETTVADTTPPAVGNGGTITTAGVSSTSLTLNWTKATDTITAQSALQYRVLRSATGNIDTLANAELNGTEIQAYTADIATLNVTSLTPSTSYFFNVIVRDASGNKAVYTMKSETTAAGADTTPPAPGGAGVITTASVGSTGLTLNWTKATDTVTAQSALQYEVRRSNSNNIDTIANAEANGTVIQAYVADIATLNVTGLTPATAYFFNVIVRDAAGNKAIYTAKSQTTSADTTAPTPGSTGTITTSGIGTTSLTLNWTKATDDITAQALLQYEVRRSSSNNIGTVANAEANGTVIQAYTADIATLNVTGLTASTGYFFNVIVRDAAGNKAAYTAKNETTAALPVTPPPPPPPPPPPADNVPPTVSITTPTGGTIWQTVIVAATASDDVGVAGVQFLLNGSPLGSEDATAPYSINWDTAGAANGSAVLTARARDEAGNLTISAPVNVTVNNQPSTGDYSVPASGGQVFVAEGGSDTQLMAGSITMEANGGSDTPSGVAVVGLRQGGVLVAEAGIPATTPILSGRILAQLDGTVSTGIALANTGSTSATISFYFTNASGTSTTPGSFTLAAGNEFAGFLDQAPFNGTRPSLGSFTFTSTVPVAAISIRAFVNERNEFLFTVVPVTPVSTGAAALVTEAVSGSPDKPAATLESPAVIPLYSVGGGWTTDVVLTNATNSAVSGTTQFFMQNGSPAPTLVGGVVNSTFRYAIPARSTIRLVATSTSSAIQTGSIWVTADSGSTVPAATAIFSYKNGEFTVSQVSVPAVARSSRYRLYAEKSGAVGSVGSIRSGIAVANTSQSPVTVFLELVRLDGQPSGFASLSLPAGGQVSNFVDELFLGFPTSFRGLLRVTSSTTATNSSPIVVTGIRGRYNERGDFLLTATPAADENALPSSTPVVFTHVLNGGGYSTQVIMFSDGGAGSGRMVYRSSTGAVLPQTTLKPQQ